MQKKYWSVSVFLFFLFIFACGSGNSKQNIAELNIDFKWNAPCTSLRDNPEITLAKVPKNTARFYVGLTDLDLPGFDHGGGYVEYRNSPIIKSGTIDGTYGGPSPPTGVIHDYEITVKALDKDGNVLAIGKKSHRFPPKGEEEIRWATCK